MESASQPSPMQTLLQQVGLSPSSMQRYLDIFQQQKIDEQALRLLNESHLNELGVVMGDRVKLLNFLHPNVQWGIGSSEGSPFSDRANTYHLHIPHSDHTHLPPSVSNVDYLNSPTTPLSDEQPTPLTPSALSSYQTLLSQLSDSRSSHLADPRIGNLQPCHNTTVTRTQTDICSCSHHSHFTGTDVNKTENYIASVDSADSLTSGSETDTCDSSGKFGTPAIASRDSSPVRKRKAVSAQRRHVEEEEEDPSVPPPPPLLDDSVLDLRALEDEVRELIEVPGQLLDCMRSDGSWSLCSVVHTTKAHVLVKLLDTQQGHKEILLTELYWLRPCKRGRWEEAPPRAVPQQDQQQQQQQQQQQHTRRGSAGSPQRHPVVFTADQLLEVRRSNGSWCLCKVMGMTPTHVVVKLLDGTDGAKEVPLDELHWLRVASPSACKEIAEQDGSPEQVPVTGRGRSRSYDTYMSPTSQRYSTEQLKEAKLSPPPPPSRNSSPGLVIEGVQDTSHCNGKPVATRQQQVFNTERLLEVRRSNGSWSLCCITGMTPTHLIVKLLDGTDGAKEVALTELHWLRNADLNDRPQEVQTLEIDNRDTDMGSPQAPKIPISTYNTPVGTPHHHHQPRQPLKHRKMSGGGDNYNCEYDKNMFSLSPTHASPVFPITPQNGIPNPTTNNLTKVASSLATHSDQQMNKEHCIASQQLRSHSPPPVPSPLPILAPFVSDESLLLQRPLPQHNIIGHTPPKYTYRSGDIHIHDEEEDCTTSSEGDSFLNEHLLQQDNNNTPRSNPSACDTADYSSCNSTTLARSIASTVPHCFSTLSPSNDHLPNLMYTGSQTSPHNTQFGSAYSGSAATTIVPNNDINNNIGVGIIVNHTTLVSQVTPIAIGNSNNNSTMLGASGTSSDESTVLSTPMSYASTVEASPTKSVEAMRNFEAEVSNSEITAVAPLSSKMGPSENFGPSPKTSDQPIPATSKIASPPPNAPQQPTGNPNPNHVAEYMIVPSNQPNAAAVASVYTERANYSNLCNIVVPETPYVKPGSARGIKSSPPNGTQPPPLQHRHSMFATVVGGHPHIDHQHQYRRRSLLVAVAPRSHSPPQLITDHAPAFPAISPPLVYL